jgi:hypothetical protein
VRREHEPRRHRLTGAIHVDVGTRIRGFRAHYPETVPSWAPLAGRVAPVYSGSGSCGRIAVASSLQPPGPAAPAQRFVCKDASFLVADRQPPPRSVQ